MENIDIRDEFYGEVPNMMPSWWGIWGIFLVFGFVLVLFILSYLIKYPDMIVAEARFTSDSPSVTLPAKTSSQIAVVKKNSTEPVEKGDYILVLKDNSNYEDILKLKKRIETLNPTNDLIPFFEQNLSTEYKLGNQVQRSWNNLNQTLLPYYKIVKQKKYELEIQRLNEELLIQQSILKQYQNMLSLDHNIAEIRDSSRSGDSFFLSDISASRMQYSESLFRNLETQKAVDQEKLSIAKHQLEITRIRNIIEQLKQNKVDQLTELRINIKKALTDLELAIEGWEESYVIQAPISGKVHFLRPLQENQHVMLNDELITITPDSMEFIAILKIPFSGAGKIKRGHDVNIKLNDYPYNEYGVLSGEIVDISGVANQDHYLGKVVLDTGNITSYNKTIQIKENSLGTAEIITDDRSWLGRILEKVIYVFRR